MSPRTIEKLQAMKMPAAQIAEFVKLQEEIYEFMDKPGSIRGSRGRAIDRRYAKIQELLELYQ